jgi:hypothetical protein
MDFYGRIYEDNRDPIFTALMNRKREKLYEIPSEIARYPPKFPKLQKDITDLVNDIKSSAAKTNTQADLVGTWEEKVGKLESEVVSL